MTKYLKLVAMSALINTLFAFSFSACASSTAQIDLQKVDLELKTTGVVGEIHGASQDADLFVFTVRDPNNFFINIQLPLTTEDTEIMTRLKTAKRHQFFTVKGELIDNKAPIKHIKVTSLELKKDYSSELDQNPHQYKSDLNELRNKSEFIGRIHAQGQDGKMLVMEYKDRIIPVLVTEPPTQALVKTFYRGDLVKIKYMLRNEPDRPLHLALERQRNLGNNQKPIELLDSLVRSHGTNIEKTGYLVKFPKSPQISFNIYALLQEDAEGTNIQYTLVNFENPELFKAVREKLEKAWNDNQKNIHNERNKLVNRSVKVTAKGESNMVDQGQANPQILIQNIDDLKIEVL